jgi:hypothetical protein
MLLVCLVVPTVGFAQTGRTDSDAFAQCSQQTNQLYHWNVELDRHHEKVEAYNDRLDFLRILLKRREAYVQDVDQQMKDDPADRELWKTYDFAFSLYERAIERIRKWNAFGDQLEDEYQSVIAQVVDMKKVIATDCSGTWELAIINKFCDDTSGRHDEFCKEFEK